MEGDWYGSGVWSGGAEILPRENELGERVAFLMFVCKINFSVVSSCEVAASYPKYQEDQL